MRIERLLPPQTADRHAGMAECNALEGHARRIGDAAFLPTPSERARYRAERAAYIAEYGFAIPTGEAILAIARHGPVLEVGAGAGYWSSLLAQHTDVIATDLTPIGTWHPVEQMGAVKAINRYSGRTVLMIWPCYGADWPARAAKVMTKGSVLAYVGEGWEGCTADDQFHRMLDDQFEQIECVYIPTFFGMRDHLTIWRKL